jgi:hypothetical protein
VRKGNERGSAGVAGAELSWAACADRRGMGKAGQLAANGLRPVLGMGEKEKRAWAGSEARPKRRKEESFKKKTLF